MSQTTKHPQHGHLLQCAEYPITVEAHKGQMFRLVGEAGDLLHAEQMIRMTLRDADTPLHQMAWDFDARGVLVIDTSEAK